MPASFFHSLPSSLPAGKKNQRVATRLKLKLTLLNCSTPLISIELQSQKGANRLLRLLFYVSLIKRAF